MVETLDQRAGKTLTRELENVAPASDAEVAFAPRTNSPTLHPPCPQQPPARMVAAPTTLLCSARCMHRHVSRCGHLASLLAHPVT